jgi:hypothetical protein
VIPAPTPLLPAILAPIARVPKAARVIAVERRDTLLLEVPKVARGTVVETPLPQAIPAPTPLPPVILAPTPLLLMILAPIARVPKAARVTVVERRDTLLLESLAAVANHHLLDPPAAIPARTPLPPVILAPTPLLPAILAPRAAGVPKVVRAAVVPKAARAAVIPKAARVTVVETPLPPVILAPTPPPPLAIPAPMIARVPRVGRALRAARVPKVARVTVVERAVKHQRVKRVPSLPDM